MADDVDTLLELWTRLAPDPVDEFEDARAAEFGLRRGPGLSVAEWRHLRFAFLEAATADEPPAAD